MDALHSRIASRFVVVPAAPTFPLLSQTPKTWKAAEAAVKLTADFNAWLNRVLDVSNPTSLLLLSAIEDSINAVFDDDSMPLRTKRFVGARAIVMEEVKKEFFACVTRLRDDIVRQAKDQLASVTCHHGTASKVAEDVINKVLYHCVFPALSTLSTLKANTAWLGEHGQALVEEEESHAERRHEAEAKLLLIQRSIETARNFDRLEVKPASDVIPLVSLF